MTVRLRLVIVFAIMALLIIAHLFLYFTSHEREHHLIEEVVKEFQVSQTLATLSVTSQAIRRYEKEYFIYLNDVEKRNGYWEEWSEARIKISQIMEQLNEQIIRGDISSGTIQIKEWSDALAFYSENFSDIHRRVTNGTITDSIRANQAIQEGKNRFKVLLDGAQQANQQRVQIVQDLNVEISTSGDQTQLIFMTLSSASVVVSIVFLLLVPNMITKPIIRLTDLANQMSKGDIKTPVQVTGSPEVVDLSKSIERLRMATQGLLKRMTEQQTKMKQLVQKVQQQQK